MQTHISNSNKEFFNNELARRPEDPTSDPARFEEAERSRGRQDAVLAEMNLRPERQTFDRGHDNTTPSARSQEGSPSHEKQSKSQEPGFLDLCHHWAWITIFSILGTLTRLGLIALNSYTGHLIPMLVWAQFVGCAVMGFVTEDDKIFPKKKSGKYDALYIGLTVGYCGSVTSFSAWILQIYEDIANTEEYQRNRGYNVISVITQVMVTLTAAVGGFRLGNHLALFVDSILPRSSAIPKVYNKAGIIFIILIAIGFQAGAIITASIRSDWRGTVGFAMVFSPIGALSRFHLSRLLNAVRPSFPLGTFTANILGSLLESIFFLLQYRVSSGTSCALLQGLQDGYCGALTTVSTFVVELCTLQRRHAYVYALVSIVVGSVLYVLVDGVDYWIHGSSGGHMTKCSY